MGRRQGCTRMCISLRLAPCPESQLSACSLDTSWGMENPTSLHPGQPASPPGPPPSPSGPACFLLLPPGAAPAGLPCSWAWDREQLGGLRPLSPLLKPVSPGARGGEAYANEQSGRSE